MIPIASDSLDWCRNGAGDRGILSWYYHGTSAGPWVLQDIYGCGEIAMTI